MRGGLQAAPDRAASRESRRYFRRADLAAGLERAVIGIEPSGHDTVEELLEMESRAQFAVGEDHEAILALMSLAREPQPGHDPHATPVLAITVWSLAHPVALMGHIELHAAGASTRIGASMPLPKTHHDSSDALSLSAMPPRRQLEAAPSWRLPCRRGRAPSNYTAQESAQPLSHSSNPRPARRPCDRPPGGQPGRSAPQRAAATHAAGARVRPKRPQRCAAPCSPRAHWRKSAWMMSGSRMRAVRYG